jgi:hypothetical protein
LQLAAGLFKKVGLRSGPVVRLALKWTRKQLGLYLLGNNLGIPLDSRLPRIEKTGAYSQIDNKQKAR